jgi:hypothetical protein
MKYDLRACTSTVVLRLRDMLPQAQLTPEHLAAGDASRK